MTREQRLKNLEVPKGPIDVVLDTDTFNEADDQFAVTYLLSCREKLNTKALYAAPFHNANSEGPADGMERSYAELHHLLGLLGESYPVFRGATAFLTDEKTPSPSAAAADLAERAMAYSPEHPLYVVAIGAITNIASAILLNPAITENIVVVWLGGHALHFHDTREFNMRQDIAAARVVMSSGAPLVQLPCRGVVSSLTLSKAELDLWLKGKGPLADYLVGNTYRYIERFEKPDNIWTRPIWDIAPLGWLMNDGGRFMEMRTVPLHLPTYDNLYAAVPNGEPIGYVYYIYRDELITDMIRRILKRVEA